MDATQTKVGRQRRRGVYRLPIAAAASAKWLSHKSDGQAAHAQTRRRRGNREAVLEPEDRAALLLAAAAERSPAPSGWGAAGGLCDDAFKQFVRECDDDIRRSSGDVGSSELGPEPDDCQETERDSLLGFTSVKVEGCEEFLKTPEADVVSELPEGKVCPTPLTQMFRDEPARSQERDDCNTELMSEENDSTTNVAQLYDCSDYAQEICLETTEGCIDGLSDHEEENESWGKSITPEQKCNFVEITGDQKSSISDSSSPAENLAENFDSSITRVKVENTKPTFEKMESMQEYVLLEGYEDEVVLTLEVGDGGRLVPVADGGAALPQGLAAQLAADADASATAGSPRGARVGGPLEEQQSPLVSDVDLVLAEEAIQEALDGLATSPPPSQRREERLHFDDVEEALDAIEGRPRARTTRRKPSSQLPAARPDALPIKMGPGVHKEVERAARALFCKRTRTLYHWMYPGTPKRKLKATVAGAWDTLPESEKLFYMSQVMGRFGTPASSLMVNPQLMGLSADQLEAERAVAGLLAAEAAAAEEEAEDAAYDGGPCRSTRKRASIGALRPFREKRSRAVQEQQIFSDTELDPCKQDTDDEISTDELFAPLGI